MFGFFTIRKAIALLLISLFFLTGASLTSYLVYDKFHTSKMELVEDNTWLARAGSQQQLAIYYRDPDVLEELLGQFLQNPVIQYAAVYDQLGNEITARHQEATISGPMPAFGEIRGDFGQLEVAQVERENPAGQGNILDLTVPVFSFVNPLEADVSRETFGQKLASARNKGAQHVMGYYLVGIDLNRLWGSMMEYGIKISAVSLTVFLCILFLVLTITRRITAPLANLAQLADDISAGKLDKTFRAKGTGEVHQIASMLNLVLSELSSHKAKMDVESHLLSMKVDERNEQLSRRNKELNQAVKQVTQAKDRLRQLAYYDSLTSLPNRQLFTEQLELLLKISKRDETTVALLFLDLDNFKRINDSLGHTAGDMLLREVAARLSSCIRESDLISQYFDAESKIGVSRLGGDEFTVVLNKVEAPKIAGVVAERLLESLQSPMLIEGHEIVITPSIGIALAPQDASTVEDLLKRADTAMYHAKTTGKNSYRYYSSAMKGILPATSEHRNGRNHRCRGPDPLGSPQARPGATGTVHTAGRGNGADRRTRCLDTDRGLPPVQGLPGTGHGTAQDRGQRIQPAIQCRFHRTGQTGPDRNQTRAPPAGTGTDRGRYHEQCQGLDPGTARTQGPGCQPVGG
jgi:diguanylate cyclase (GGDEF)-like protein